MKTSSKALLVTAALVTATTSLPASAAYVIFGHSNNSCGNWTSDQEKDSFSNLGYRSWVQGFVSGSGWVGGIKYDTDSDGMKGFIDNYCKANPFKDVSDAAEALVRELEK